jgi:hypothetical protein
MIEQWVSPVSATAAPRDGLFATGYCQPIHRLMSTLAETGLKVGASEIRRERPMEAFQMIECDASYRSTEYREFEAT